MLSRVAAVEAPRTHNRRRVTGSSGRRREGRESERQRPNMSRRVFTSAVLLLLVVMMWCGIGGGTAVVDGVEEPLSSETKFQWEAITEGETVASLRVPSLVVMNGEVFAVAEAQCKKDSETSGFTGIASQIITNTADNKPEEVLKNAKDTQVLEEVGSGKATKVDVRRPTAVVDESNIYMFVGKNNRTAAATCQAETENIKSGMLLVKGQVSGDGDNKKIDWKTTDGVPCTLGEQHASLTGLIGGGGSGVKMNDGTLVFPVEGTKREGAGKDEKTVSLILYSSKEVTNWKLSKGMSADGCSVPSVVEWKDKLMMMTACDDGRRRVYETGDKGESWTEALGTLSRVWGNKHEGKAELVRSGFTTATIGDGDDKRNVMLVTLLVYADNDNSKGVLHLWLTDNTHIVDIGLISGKDDDAAASSLLHKSGDANDKLIALYEKKKVDAEKPSLGMVSVRLTEQLQRVKEVLATWKEVDERVSKLCPLSSAAKDASTATACSTAFKITDGLVGFLSGNFSGTTWKDEYLGVNATVNNEDGKVTSTDNGVRFTGRGAWAEWPVGKQGENQLYHFANYNFTLVATVSIHEAPKSGSIPLMGAKLNDSDNTVLLGLSYNDKEKKWILLCDGGENKEQSRVSEPEKAQHVVILLRNGSQGSAYVDGQPVGGDEQCELKTTESKEISHFYIGGDGGSAEGQEDVPVTVTNVLLYNRPLSSEEIPGLAKNKVTIPKPEGPKSSEAFPRSPMVGGSDMEGTVTQSNSAGQRPLEQELLKENIGVGAGGVSGAASVTTPSADAKTPASNGEGKVEPAVKKEMSVNSGEDEDTADGTDAQGEEGIHLQVREVNATALSSSLANVSQGNNSDGGTMSESGLLPSLLLLLGLWGFAAL
ncbi:putative trans-sialidase, Group V [Trypanosoma cruzi]|nr:putative trans-sialidase, Group V [Trypanosoma cruzi]